jgi:hypothetical protein
LSGAGVNDQSFVADDNCQVLVDDEAEIQHTVKDKAATNQSFVQVMSHNKG